MIKTIKIILTLAVIAVLIPIVLMVGNFAAIILFQDNEIRALNDQRKIAFARTRPAFLKYRKDHNAFPENLQALVPNYLPLVPEVLLNNTPDDPVLKITYAVENGSAGFHFRTTHGPDSGAYYDIGKDIYLYDP